MLASYEILNSETYNKKCAEINNVPKPSNISEHHCHIRADFVCVGDRVNDCRSVSMAIGRC